MISQMLVIGGAISVVLATECFENIMNYAVYKLQDKSVKILVPCIVTMMSLLGAFAGSDSMIIFVTVGILICRKLKLDRICAMAMFYLGYLIGQGASITSTVLINVQTMAEVPPLSDMAVRVPIWIIFTAVNAFYCTRYALKVYHDPNRSLLGCVLEETEDMGEIKEMKTPVTSIILAVLMFATYVLYAIGGKNWGWGLDYLFALVILLAIASAIIARMPANKAAQTYFKGTQSMGGICLVFGLAKVVGTIITESTTVYWLAEVASNTFGKLGTVGAVLAIYVFILLFNLLIPSSSSKGRARHRPRPAGHRLHDRRLPDQHPDPRLRPSLRLPGSGGSGLHRLDQVRRASDGHPDRGRRHLPGRHLRHGHLRLSLGTL